MSEDDSRKLRGQQEAQRMESTRALGRSHTETSVMKLVERLRDPSRAVQDTARDALIEIRGEPVVKALIPLLDDENPQTRNLAIDILGHVGIDAPGQLHHVIVSGSDDAKIFSLDILGALKHADSVEAIARAFESDNVNVRNAGAMALSRIASPRAVPYLMKALEDDEWVRFSAIEGLARSGSPQVVGTLVDKLRDSREMDYYSGILECFVQMRHPAAIVPLLLELCHVSAKHHATIVEALVELISIQPPEAEITPAVRKNVRPALETELTNPDPWCVFRALDVIHWLGDRDYLDAVLDVFSSGNELTQAGAVRALGAIATKDDAPRLKALLGKDSLVVKDELDALMKKLTA
ncbi:MAG: HEAT repeat domain-containing protein [Planctomycetes bacterium]|nr:HEAT repeat domain-containing protein [Planctomycetota bacterium]NUQ34642.1 HEAT repeat domain-containing protein [Planctomycetaceae bacterium]